MIKNEKMVDILGSYSETSEVAESSGEGLKANIVNGASYARKACLVRLACFYARPVLTHLLTSCFVWPLRSQSAYLNK